MVERSAPRPVDHVVRHSHNLFYNAVVLGLFLASFLHVLWVDLQHLAMRLLRKRLV